MKKWIYCFVLALLGLLLAQKRTYWVPGTYQHDVIASAFGILGGALIGLLIGCIVEDTISTRRRLLKILYWVLMMAIFGLYIGSGKSVPAYTTLVVMGWTVGLGVLFGFLQYFFPRFKS